MDERTDTELRKYVRESMATEPAGNDDQRECSKATIGRSLGAVSPAYFTGNTVFDAVPIKPAARQTAFPVKHPISLGGYSLIWLGGLYTGLIDKICCLKSVRNIRVAAVTTRPLTDHTRPNPISPETRCVSPLTTLTTLNPYHSQPLPLSTLTTHKILRSQLLALTPISAHSC